MVCLSARLRSILNFTNSRSMSPCSGFLPINLSSQEPPAAPQETVSHHAVPLPAVRDMHALLMQCPYCVKQARMQTACHAMPHAPSH